MSDTTSLCAMIGVVAISIASAVALCTASDDKVKVECHRAQIAAYAASAPSVPACL